MEKNYSYGGRVKIGGHPELLAPSPTFYTSDVSHKSIHMIGKDL